MQNGKGQMEIMGLAIIVILVILGVLFAVSIMLKPPSETERVVRESTIANNFISTYLDTVTDCFDSSMRDLLKDCALGAAIQCPDGRDSCGKVDLVTNAVLDSTLNTWKKKYRFIFEGSESVEQFTTQEGTCKGQKESSKPYAVPVRPGLTLNLRIEICDR